MEFRNYREQDYEAVCDFLVELNRKDRLHIHWNWARFEWMYEHPEFDKTAKEAFGLWWDGGRIVGASIYDMYFGEAFCGALPEYAELYPEILRYAVRELSDENGLGTAICDDNDAEIAAAKAMGFRPAEQTETLLRIDLDRVLPARLPEGYALTQPDPVADAEALQWLFWRGFDHGEDRAEFEREEKIVPQIRPHFDPRLSLAAADPSGELAACCCLWYLPGTDYAYVEPVCTVPAHRGRGLASALLEEGLNRAAELGARSAYVISDLGFYKALGFRPAHHFTFWWKDPA